MMITAPDPAEVSEATPTLAVVAKKLMSRPFYLLGEPFPLDYRTWVKAEAEMKAVLKARGWPSTWSADIGRHNFLFFGTPIVAEQ